MLKADQILWESWINVPKEGVPMRALTIDLGEDTSWPQGVMVAVGVSVISGCNSSRFSLPLPEELLGLSRGSSGLWISAASVHCLGSCLEEGCCVHMTQHRGWSPCDSQWNLKHQRNWVNTIQGRREIGSHATPGSGKSCYIWLRRRRGAPLL